MSRRARASAATLLLGVAAGCAKMQAPPGGPPDPKPPELVRIVPETGSVNVRPPRVVFQFDETIQQQLQGAASLNRMFLISPADGEPRVDWDRSTLTVRPRRGFRPNTVYVITMLPGISDIRGNARKDGATAIFSTGPTIPNTTLAGIVFDWPAGRPAVRPYVEAIGLPDSTVYVTIGDSVGGFAIRHLPPGRYAVRGTIDQNNNRARDARELYDSLDVALGDSARLELLAFVHDTIGPRINEVAIRDSLTLRVQLDKPLDPAAPLGPELFSLRAADSSVVPIAAALTPR
ncbi:MAG TPA: Ig-like domain-containing protein, partial [Gemmatimonadaceae bacterium]|nr:Ig-like domain-containing protein [Gemmatimonadaceae bacterium]